MDVAFPLIFIFIFLMPGLFFINSYYKIESLDVNFVPISQKTALAIVIAIILHFIAIFILINCFDLYINPDKYINLLSSERSQTFELAELAYFSIYIIILSITAFFLGVGIRKSITYFKLDKNWKWLRISNRWYYFFKAFDFEKEEPELVELFAMIDAAGQCYLYRGFLEEFYLDNKGNLDTLILSSVSRTLTNRLENIETQDEIISLDDFYQIEGDYFMLKYSEVINFEVFFITLSKLKANYRNS